ncbi:MAG: transporter substrate-binding domain-containing protein [Roseibium sp.]
MINKAVFGFLSVLIILIGQPIAVRAENPCLRIATHPSILNDIIVPRLQSALQDRGICITITTVATKRATLLLQQGKIDGEAPRVKGYRSKVEGFAVMVPEPFVEGYGLIVTTNEKYLLPDQLLDKKIGVGRGSTWQQVFLPKGAVPVVIDDYKHGFAMLRANRIVGLMIEDINLKNYVEPSEAIHSRRLTPKLSGHLFLHTRHKGLVPAFNQAILDWKKEIYVQTKGM